MRLRRADLRAEKTFRGIERADMFILENFDGEEGIGLAFDVGNAVFQSLGIRRQGISELNAIEREAGAFRLETASPCLRLRRGAEADASRCP